MPKLSTRVWDAGARDDANWSGWNTDYHSIDNGGFKITPPGNTSGSWPLFRVEPEDMTESWVSVELRQALTAAGTVTTQFLCIADSPTNANYVGFSLNNGTLTFRRRVAGTNNDTSTTYNATTHKWLRLRESAGTVYWDTSTDGVTWTNRRLNATGLTLTAVTVYMNGAVSSTAVSNPGSAIFDNINLPSPRAFFRFF
jgi:hypothetical protein